jgi:hypothetical protein
VTARERYRAVIAVGPREARRTYAVGVFATEAEARCAAANAMRVYAVPSVTAVPS